MPGFTPLECGKYYHVYNPGNNGDDIFREHRNYLYFFQLYAKYIEPIAETFAYCLLRNHFHFLLGIRSPEDQTYQVPETWQVLQPARQFSHLFNSYAKAINKAYKRTGSLFEKPFGRIEVPTEQYFLSLVHYVHFNPQKQGFVRDFQPYPYSSYPTILSTKPTRLQRERLLEWFDGREAFALAHREAATAKGIEGLIGDDAD